LAATLAKHPDLRTEAEQIAVDMISSPSVDDVAEDVRGAVTSLGIDSFHGRTGKQPWGYVEPSQAAWDLLGEAVEDILADMKRRMDLGLHEAAEPRFRAADRAFWVLLRRLWARWADVLVIVKPDTIGRSHRRRLLRPRRRPRVHQRGR